MKREHFSLTTVPAGDTPAAPDVPTLRITYSGNASVLQERLTDAEGSPLDGADVDVAFRKREGETGVLSIAERLTGTFIAELEADIAAVEQVIEAAEADDDRYRVEIVIDDDHVTFEKQTLLVYETTGQLLRSRSLIPGSVEL
ncbi:MAG: DUF5793 family protein [Halorhabdus sp.]